MTESTKCNDGYYKRDEGYFYCELFKGHIGKHQCKNIVEWDK